MSSTHLSSRAHRRASSVSSAKHSARLSRGSHSFTSFSSTLFSAFNSPTPFAASTGCGTSGGIADQTGFEDADGNLAVTKAGCMDWNSFSPTWTGSAPNQLGTATLGGLTFVGRTDAVNSSNDNIYAGGVKQDTTCPGTTTGNANDKADLARIYIATETIGGHVYLFLAWERQLDTTVNSDVFVSFEFNQGNVSCGGTSPFVKRMPGDLLFDYNFQSGNSTISAEQWDGSTWQALPAPPFEALVNTPTVTDTIGPSGSASLTQFEFGEAGIDLSALNLTGNGGKKCETFGSVLGGSRTSKSGDQAQLKDFVAPAPVNVSNCVTPTIVTTQEPASGSTGDKFKDKATISGLATPDGTGTLTFTLYPQADCKGTPVDTETINNISLNGDYETPNGVTLNTAGTYYWVASFSGDNFNNAGSSGCNDEPVAVNAPNLSVVKKADNASVSAGDPLGFTITVSNGGPGVAKGVTLDDPLPGGTKAGWTLDSNSGSANCSISNATPQDLTCDAVDLKSGDSYVLHISADTSFEACTEYDNTATASASNAPNAQGSDDITCNKPSLSVVKKADNAVVDAGDPLGFTITVSNGGPGTAKGVTLDDPLPGGTKAGWTLDSNSGSANCSITNATPQHLVCSAVDLKSGESYVLHISADTDFADCTAYDNTATASASNAPDAQGSDSIQCEGPHLKVTKTADANTVNAGDPIGFKIVVTNDGLGTAKNVTLDDPLPTGTATGWTIDAGPTGSVTPTCSISNGSPQDLTCDAVNLKPGDSYTIHVTAGTSFEACTEYDNTATASASNAPDAQGSDDITCNKPSLTVTKTADAESVNAGESIGFKVVVANGGPGTAKGVTLNDPLPAGTASGWTIDQAPTAPPTCSISNGTPQHLTCSAVDLKPGDSYTVHVTAKTSQAACTKYDNTATASASNAPDANGSASVTCKPADVTITKTADHSAPVNAGDQIGFTVEVKNTGTGDATGVKLADALPAGSGSGVTWSVDNSVGTPARFVLSGAKGSQTLELASTTVPAGADYKVHIVATTSETECSVYDNRATLTTDNAGNPEPVNATESCAFRVDLSVTKTGAPAEQELGQGNITWTMVVTNNGPDDDTGVVINDPMPSGNTFVSAQTTQGTCTGGAILHCAIGNMAAGASVTITLVTTPSQVGAQTNTVVVAGDKPEANLANNTATATVQVGPFTPPCVAVSRITPKQLFVGRKTLLTIYLTQAHKAVKGVRVRIKGPKINVRTRPSNAKGIIKRVVTMKKKGIIVITPLASPVGQGCSGKRIGVTGVFTPPVTG